MMDMDISMYLPWDSWATYHSNMESQKSHRIRDYRAKSQAGLQGAIYRSNR